MILGEMGAGVWSGVTRLGVNASGGRCTCFCEEKVEMCFWGLEISHVWRLKINLGKRMKMPGHGRRDSGAATRVPGGLAPSGESRLAQAPGGSGGQGPGQGLRGPCRYTSVPPSSESNDLQPIRPALPHLHPASLLLLLLPPPSRIVFFFLLRNTRQSSGKPTSQTSPRIHPPPPHCPLIALLHRVSWPTAPVRRPQLPDAAATATEVLTRDSEAKIRYRRPETPKPPASRPRRA